MPNQGTSLQGKVVLIAGASTGIGRGTALAAAQAGAASLVLLARRDMSELAGELTNEHGCQAIPVRVDLSSAEEVARAAQQIRDAVGVPDVFVFSSASGGFRCVEEYSPDSFVTAMSSCVFATAFLIHEFIDELIARNAGHLVFVGASSYRMDMPYTSYKARMGAFRGLFEAIQADLGQDADNQIRLLWAEPPNVLDNSYYDNNPGVDARVPVAANNPKFQASSLDIGRDLVRQIERGGSLWRPAAVSFLLWLYSTPLRGALNRALFKFAPPDEGGPPCGHRRRA
jgi:NAD(P)-dependent dehydrogenase (short-subunit alcohol dehydrogenase family)